jgi:hypothetical protein
VDFQLVALFDSAAVEVSDGECLLDIYCSHRKSAQVPVMVSEMILDRGHEVGSTHICVLLL